MVDPFTPALTVRGKTLRIPAAKENCTMPTAYSYLRFSNPSQAKGDSTRRQHELRDNWLARNPAIKLDVGFRLDDKGISAFKGKNLETGALGAFIKAVDAGKVKKGSFLILEKLDRFSRTDVDVDRFTIECHWPIHTDASSTNFQTLFHQYLVVNWSLQRRYSDRLGKDSCFDHLIPSTS
jgi:hypothetical protein